MAIEIKLPELGDGIESGDVLDVLVSEGQTISKDQTICELETDKAMVEIPATQGGTIVKVHIASGQSVPIGATLVTVEAETPATSPEPAIIPTPPLANAPPTETPPASQPAPNAERPEIAPAPTPNQEPSSPTPNVPPPVAKSALTDQESIAPAPAGPAIRRLAREVGIDLAQVRGTGPGGRIMRDDVLSAVRQSSTPSVTAEEEKPRSDAPLASSPSEAATVERPPQSDEWGPIRIERLTKIRQTIARKMHASWSTVPRVTNFDDADITELESIRQASKKDYAARGIKLTSLPFVIKAVALALKQNPVVNAAIDEDQGQVIYKQYVNLGIAVDTDRGLVVPSLRGPDELSIPDIARSLGVIAENARNNDFEIQDLRGSTFTISNLGAVGGTYSTPIVNVPEVAILLLGRSRKIPVVNENDEINVRLMMPLSLSYDHRLVDGAAASRFLNDVIGYLEHPSRLLIAP